MPTTPSRSSARPSFRQLAASASGMPKSRTPRPKSPARRPRPISTPAITAPRRPPTPDAALSQPTVAAPASRNDRAITAMRTPSNPSTKVWAAKRPTRSATLRSRAIARAPASSSSATPPASHVSALGAPDTRIPRMIRGAELFRRRRQDRRVGSLRRAKGCACHAHERGEHINHRCTAAREHGERSQGDQGGTDEVRDDQDEAPVVPVAQQGRERRCHGRSAPAKQADQADGPGPTVPVGEDDDGDPVGPGPDDRTGPRELEPEQAPIVEDCAKAAPRVFQPLPHPPHRLSIPCLRCGAGRGKIWADFCV